MEKKPRIRMPKGPFHPKIKGAQVEPASLARRKGVSGMRQSRNFPVLKRI